MSYSPRTILVGAAVSFALTTLARAADTDSLGIGYVASPAQIAGWDIDVRADGQGLSRAMFEHDGDGALSRV
jgi:S-disulfanyl-L-cysteine oxidoreductase SoxD